eukprot:GDKI01012661.1.p3 GENE.GDKI01012661.1~~GDKI01012661.1.p3  ORF type:complete len:128 (-),score=25.51 GDKI01012661.1:88-471(-)
MSSTHKLARLIELQSMFVACARAHRHTHAEIEHTDEHVRALREREREGKTAQRERMPSGDIPQRVHDRQAGVCVCKNESAVVVHAQIRAPLPHWRSYIVARMHAHSNCDAVRAQSSQSVQHERTAGE